MRGECPILGTNGPKYASAFSQEGQTFFLISCVLILFYISFVIICYNILWDMS